MFTKTKTRSLNASEEEEENDKPVTVKNFEEENERVNRRSL